MRYQPHALKLGNLLQCCPFDSLQHFVCLWYTILVQIVHFATLGTVSSVPS
nr:MAG TPA: hypothetical protein [Caudoviricetes sp.]